MIRQAGDLVSDDLVDKGRVIDLAVMRTLAAALETGLMTLHDDARDRDGLDAPPRSGRPDDLLPAHRDVLRRGGCGPKVNCFAAAPTRGGEAAAGRVQHDAGGLAGLRGE